MGSKESSNDASETGITRRSLIAGAAAAAGGALAGGALKATELAAGAGAQEAADPTKVPGDRPQTLGSRSPHETPEKLVSGSIGGVTRTPLQDLHGTITPSDLHFERHHHGIPRIDPSAYRLLIHGMVDRPMVFTLDDLKRFPSVASTWFVECSGNGGAGYTETPRPDMTPQELDGLLSCSEWTGVAVRTLFEEVGVHDDATWFLAEGSDAAVMSRSIPVEKAWDDAVIAYGQNGEAIRPEQGYPARLLLPGWEGNSCVKWIRRIELSDRPFMMRDETSKYSDPLSDGTARMFSFDMDAKSLITYPAHPVRLERDGFVEITGYAWSGRGRIDRVDVSLDGGASWGIAALQEPVLSKSLTRFRFGWMWDGEPAHLMSRAVDETGYVQPTVAEMQAARGPRSRYHYNTIRGWRVAADGSVTFATA
ncbi:MAG: sulfite dehydrogenase [Gemmatimonadota bacterium]|nr:sulfite dehydrogenase [Gemmatimonadota bacterium]